MDGEHESRARRMLRTLEPYHAIAYFAPEPQAACTELGTRGFWMSYFAQRAAPLGAAPPEVVAALFYNFAPRLVARAVPDVWAVAPPGTYLRVRLAAVDAALRRVLGADVLASPEVAEAAELARAAAAAAPRAGRALGAANAALPWPEPPHLVLWHAQTVLRELRGDGHVAVLLATGLDPVECSALLGADLGMDPDGLRVRRGWTEHEWADGVGRLAERGLVDGTGLTTDGRALRAEVERRTDALADPAWAALGADRTERLRELVLPLTRTIVASDSFLVDNPMGLRPPASAARTD